MSEQNFDEHDIESVFQDILHGEDRISGIVGGAFLEDTLEMYLRIHIDRELIHAGLNPRRKDIEKVVNVLFSPEHPLGSQSAKVGMALALGLIGPIVHNDLVQLNTIRNQFAHYMLMSPDGSPKRHRVTFKTQKIAAICSNLKLLGFQNRPIPQNPRIRFAHTCVAVFEALHKAISTEMAKYRAELNQISSKHGGESNKPPTP
jgi:hypothetical protein